MGEKSTVSIVRCNSYTQELLYPKVKEALSLLGGMNSFIKPGSKVLVKPNLLMAAGPDKCITTHPEFVRSAIRVLKDMDCRIYLGDGPSVFGWRPVEALNVYEAAGMKQVASDEGVELVVFEKRFMQGYFPLTSWVKECDYILNLPKFKTHEFMIMTGAVKNLFGLVPGTFKMEVHKNFYEPEKFADVLLDIYLAAKPAVSIVDAIRGIDGNGPATSGRIREFGFILASQDAVSLDCVLARIMNVEPELIPTNRQAKNRKIGNADLGDIEVRGETISACIINDFKLPETSFGQVITGKLSGPLKFVFKKLIYLRPRIDSDICRLCEACINNCPQKIISERNGKLNIDYSRCISCFCCREVCPYAAVKVKKSFLARAFRM